MALLISLYLDKGEECEYSDFYVEDIRVSLYEIKGPREFKLKVHGKAIDNIVEVNDFDNELMPEVYVHAGLVDSGKIFEVKVALTAPRRISIKRGIIYRENNVTSRSKK